MNFICPPKKQHAMTQLMPCLFGLSVPGTEIGRITPQRLMHAHTVCTHSQKPQLPHSQTPGMHAA